MNMRVRMTEYVHEHDISGTVSKSAAAYVLVLSRKQPHGRIAFLKDKQHKCTAVLHGIAPPPH